MAVIWDKHLFEEEYKCNGWPYGIRFHRVPIFHYNWFGQQRMTQANVNRFFALPESNKFKDVAIVGGGFGWTAEVLKSYDINAISIDTSSHILSTKNTSEEDELREYLIKFDFDPDNLPEMMSPENPNEVCDPWDYWLRPDGKRTSTTVIDEDMSTTGSRNSIKASMNNKIDLILTEYALESSETENDALSFIERCEQLRPNPAVKVIHQVTDPPHNSYFVSKTPLEWRALLDSNGYNHVIADMMGNILIPGG